MCVIISQLSAFEERCDRIGEAVLEVPAAPPPPPPPPRAAAAAADAAAALRMEEASRVTRETASAGFQHNR